MASSTNHLDKILIKDENDLYRHMAHFVDLGFSDIQSLTLFSGHEIMWKAFEKHMMDVVGMYVSGNVGCGISSNYKKHGETMLHVAVRESHVEKVMALLELVGVSTDILDSSDRDAFQLALFTATEWINKNIENKTLLSAMINATGLYWRLKLENSLKIVRLIVEHRVAHKSISSDQNYISLRELHVQKVAQSDRINIFQIMMFIMESISKNIAKKFESVVEMVGQQNSPVSQHVGDTVLSDKIKGVVSTVTINFNNMMDIIKLLESMSIV